MRLVDAARRSRLRTPSRNSTQTDRRPLSATRIRRRTHRHAPPETAHLHPAHPRRTPASLLRRSRSCPPAPHRRTLVRRRRSVEPPPCLGRRRTRRHPYPRPERPPGISLATAATLPEGLSLVLRSQSSLAVRRGIDHSDPPAHPRFPSRRYLLEPRKHRPLDRTRRRRRRDSDILNPV